MAEVTEYERKRALRIQENRRKMEQLGLLEASQGFARAAGAAAAAPPVTLEPGGEQQPRMKKRRVQQYEPAPLEPTRLSRRLRGEAAPELSQIAVDARAEVEAAGGQARRGTSRRHLSLDEGVTFSAPFSLWSIGVTVWELGIVHRGAWAHRYWSSSGCLFHHAYPVGYHATKVQFGRTYEMRIEEGPTGPVFKVIDQQTGTVFSGESPTKPWTDVCLAHRTGQRISGPLFFGFSDPVTQRAIATNLYSEQELQAALQGEKLQGSAATPDEQAAQEFCSVDGIGEATAIVLARSTALGGSRHAGLASLQAWASASDDNAQALFDYLTSSSEMPESTRRWPAWRQRLVPKIVQAVSSRWLGTGPPPAAAFSAAATSGSSLRRETSAAPHPGSTQQETTAEEDASATGGTDSAAAVKPQQVASGSGRAKENRPTHNRAVAAAPLMPPAVAAAAAAAASTAAVAAAPALLSRSSRRERKANSKFAGWFLTDDSDMPQNV